MNIHKNARLTPLRREEMAEAVLSGETVRRSAEVFRVSVASAVTWTQRYRATGSAAAKPMGGRRHDAMAAGRDDALARLAEHPSLALRALQADLAERGVRVRHGAIWHFVHAEGLSFKKSALARETLRPDLARTRERWRKHQGQMDPSRLVFLDETWVKTNMAPLRGWAPLGERLAGRHPHGHWRTLTFLAALRADRIDAPCLFGGPINGESFTAGVDHALIPTLSPGDVVVMDNLGSHKGQAVRAAIRAAGAHLLFLPPYSPDPCGAKNSPLDCFLHAPHPSNRFSPSSSTVSARPPAGPRTP
jgi:transposase